MVLWVDSEAIAAIKYDSRLNVIKITARGNLNNDIWLKIVSRAAKLSRENLCMRVFCDYTEMKLTESVLGIYNYPLAAAQSGIPPRLKIAVLYSRDESNHKFWENRCRNTGLNVGVFKKNTDAIRWLTCSN